MHVPRQKKLVFFDHQNVNFCHHYVNSFCQFCVSTMFKQWSVKHLQLCTHVYQFPSKFWGFFIQETINWYPLLVFRNMINPFVPKCSFKTLEKRVNVSILLTTSSHCTLIKCFWVFLSRNYRLIVALRKFDILKTNICPRSEASRANMLVLRTSNFQGATIRLIVLRHEHSIVFLPGTSSKINRSSFNLFRWKLWKPKLM